MMDDLHDSKDYHGFTDVKVIHVTDICVAWWASKTHCSFSWGPKIGKPFQAREGIAFIEVGQEYSLDHLENIV